MEVASFTDGIGLCLGKSCRSSSVRLLQALSREKNPVQSPAKTDGTKRKRRTDRDMGEWMRGWRTDQRLFRVIFPTNSQLGDTGRKGVNYAERLSIFCWNGSNVPSRELHNTTVYPKHNHFLFHFQNFGQPVRISLRSLDSCWFYCCRRHCCCCCFVCTNKLSDDHIAQFLQHLSNFFSTSIC